ncbi:MAG: DUF302 domain-containing protein [Ilumatobacteraceae bacterium]
MRDVGTLPLSREIEARTGRKEKLLTIYNFCSPMIVRRMADFSPHMAAYMPCRITLVEKDDGLWLYTLNIVRKVVRETHKKSRKLPRRTRTISRPNCIQFFAQLEGLTQNFDDH